MLISLAYRLTRKLLGVVATVARRDVSKDAELLVLRHENAVLRRHVEKVSYRPEDRLWFAALSGLIPRRRWAEAFRVAPGTLLAWHRKLVAGKYRTAPARPGRRPTAAAVRALVIRMADDNPLSLASDVADCAVAHVPIEHAAYLEAFVRRLIDLGLHAQADAILQRAMSHAIDHELFLQWADMAGGELRKHLYAYGREPDGEPAADWTWPFNTAAAP